MPKLIDCFMFYNEKEMLNYRLHVLDSIVDYVVIVESTHTHAGKEKPLFSNDVKELFDKFKHKIVHVVVEDFPFIYPNIKYEWPDLQQWKNENHQRNCIRRGLDKLSLSDEDIFVVSDLDEIPDPDTLSKIKKGEIQVTINCLEMDFYFYNLNSIMKRRWTTGKIVSYKLFRERNLTCQDIRHYPRSPIIQKGGWHLTYFGDTSFIKNKLENFAHTELNRTEFTDAKRIEERIAKGNDINDCETLNHISVKDNPYLPVDYEIYLSRFFSY